MLKTTIEKNQFFIRTVEYLENVFGVPWHYLPSLFQSFTPIFNFYKFMKKTIKLILVSSIAIFLSACYHEVEEVVKAEEVTLSPTPVSTPVLVETDMMPSSSK